MADRIHVQAEIDTWGTILLVDAASTRVDEASLNTGIDEVKSYVNDISVTPLAIPMICGPGAITNAIVLMEDAGTIQKKVLLFTAIITVMMITYLTLFSSSKLIKLLGQTGNNVLMRLMGLIMMVIAVEFFFSGLKPIILNILR